MSIIYFKVFPILLLAVNIYVTNLEKFFNKFYLKKSYLYV